MNTIFLMTFLATLAISSAFVSVPPFVGRSVISTTELDACRVNAKKEKRQRNRENMRKFQKRGKTSRKKMMRKLASGDQRQIENEFIARCFTSAVVAAVTEGKAQ